MIDASDDAENRNPSNAALLEVWRDEPAPLLPLLHAFHERDGHLSEEALHFVAKGLRIPIADLFGTITFYHHFSRDAGGLARPRVCTGPVCTLRGAAGLIAELEASGANPEAMPCPGRCETPIPVLQGATVSIGTTATELVADPAPLPPTAPEGISECVFADIRESGQHTLTGYRSRGGYESLAKAVNELEPSDVLDLMDASGLAGRGGAGFPTGRKWRAVADAEGSPKTIVCNADEGEPGCFKDRVLMDANPHSLIEGMAIAARACGANRGFIYLRYEYPDTFHTLETAITEAESAGLLGDNILDSDFSF
ncbi:MAG: NADH-quinone oxidoreductase subunit F, partial [Myxococcota bacterium]